ncbi:ExbD/TolR family protein [Methylovulum psychrotolerans]|uniref:ExbD/TolR family protein n=1 Tax=Methylovulum psychrotolerans TaxID=1704499 RepID=UPI001E345418|nr:biopolymer transporter ExbD [Methylovulum psychrotolerans]
MGNHAHRHRTFIDTTSRLKLPKTEQTEPAPDRHAVMLSVTVDGRALSDERAVALAALLEAELKPLQEQDPEIKLQLQADRTAMLDVVAKVMASAQRSGIGKLSFVTMLR